MRRNRKHVLGPPQHITSGSRKAWQMSHCQAINGEKWKGPKITPGTHLPRVRIYTVQWANVHSFNELWVIQQFHWVITHKSLFHWAILHCSSRIREPWVKLWFQWVNSHWSLFHWAIVPLSHCSLFRWASGYSSRAMGHAEPLLLCQLDPLGYSPWLCELKAIGSMRRWSYSSSTLSQLSWSSPLVDSSKRAIT